MLQMFRSLWRQLVNPHAPICRGDAPLGFDQLFLQETLERRVERAFFDLKQIVRRSLNVLRQRVAVKRLPLQRSENHHLQCPGKKVSLLAVFHELEVLSKP